MTLEDQPPKTCLVCGKTNTNDGGPLLRCSRCRHGHRVHYCSRQCQAKDWPRHKGICGLDMEELQDYNERSKAWNKKMKQVVKSGTPVLCSSETAFGLVLPHSPVPAGVPTNFALKQQAMIHYQQGTSSKGKLGNMMGEKHFRAYYDDIVEQKKVWMTFFDHPGNHNHLVPTVGILGTLAVVYRQRGTFGDCEAVLDLSAELLAIYERNVNAMEDPIDIWNYRSFRFRQQHARYNMYFLQGKYDQNVVLYRELMDYELRQNNTSSGVNTKDQFYLKMVKIILGKAPTFNVLESLTDEEIMKMVLAPLERGLPKDFLDCQEKVALKKCGNCSVEEKALASHQGCSRCQQVFYCGRKCQQEHWKHHRKSMQVCFRKAPSKISDAWRSAWGRFYLELN